MGQKTWGTNVIRFQAGNGVTALIAYNPSCTSNPYDNMIDGSDCYALVYDTSGNSSPNEINKDVRRNANAIGIDPSTCAFKISGQCFSAPVKAPPVYWESCTTQGTSTSANDQKLMSELGIPCGAQPADWNNNADYWAGAIQACGGADNLMSVEDLIELAKDLYNNPNIKDTNFDDPSTNGNLQLDVAKVEAYGFDLTLCNGALCIFSNNKVPPIWHKSCYLLGI